MRRRAPAGRHTVSYSRPHLIRIPIPSPPSFNAPPGVIWTFDRNDGDAPVELQTHSCIAMIEAPWAVRARCLAAQCATAARTSYASPFRRPRHPSPPRPPPPLSHLHHPPWCMGGVGRSRRHERRTMRAWRHRARTQPRSGARSGGRRQQIARYTPATAAPSHARRLALVGEGAGGGGGDG